MITVHIKDLKIKTIIGTKVRERKTRQAIILNISLKYKAQKAIAKDNLRYALDYEKLTKQIVREIKWSRFFLLETLVSHISKILMRNKNVLEATIRVDKSVASRHAKSVAIELHKKQKRR